MEILKIESKNVKINTRSIKPGLIIEIRIKYAEGFEMPVSVSGLLQTSDGKEIALLSEYPRNLSKKKFNLITLEQNPNRYDGFSYFELHCALDEHSIEYIESMRHKNPQKDVKLGLMLEIKHMVTGLNLRNTVQQFNLLHITSQEAYQEILISHGEWINKFSGPLGIGNFTLLEINEDILQTIYDKFNPDDEKFDKLREKILKSMEVLKSMNLQLKKGEWDLVIRQSREFFELNKLGKNNTLESELKNLYVQRNETDVGFKDFYEALFSMFKYISKFIHEIDENGNPHKKPIAKSEDAYFIYATCVSALRIVVGKL